MQKANATLQNIVEESNHLSEHTKNLLKHVGSTAEEASLINVVFSWLRVGSKALGGPNIKQVNAYELEGTYVAVEATWQTLKDRLPAMPGILFFQE